MAELLAIGIMTLLFAALAGLIAGYLLRDAVTRSDDATRHLHARLRYMESNLSELWGHAIKGDAAAKLREPAPVEQVPSDEEDSDPGMRAHREMYGDDEAVTE